MNDHFGIHALEPRWFPHQRVRQGWLPPQLRPWLLDTGSLTQRLIHCCHGQFRLEVLSQGWGYPQLNEARALALPLRRRALIRQVYLLCDETPWVFARTVIPERSLRGRQRRLKRLGNRPLGAVLFADPSMRRSPMELTRIDHGQRLFRRAVGKSGSPSTTIWGRRSLFRLGRSPLLVSEIFLPELPQEEG